MAFLGCWLRVGPLLFPGDRTPLVPLTPGPEEDVHFLRIWARKWVRKRAPYDASILGGDLLPVAVFIRNASGKEGGGCWRGLRGGYVSSLAWS